MFTTSSIWRLRHWSQNTISLMRAPRHRNSTRDREKAELSMLRGLVVDLEAHLAVLRRGRQPQKPTRSAWCCLSECQARAREAVEHTNRVLNDKVQGNADWIQQEVSSLKRIADLQQKVEDDLVLNQLKQLAEAAVPQLPDVFAANGIQLNSTLRGGVERDLWSHVQTGDFRSTLVCVRRVPFDMHSTSAAIWTTLSYPDKSFAAENNLRHDVTPVARVLKRTSTVCAMKFQGAIQNKYDEFTPLNYHAVVHRTAMTDTHSTNVFVWKSFFKFADESVKHHDTMWLTVEKCTSGGLESIVTVVCQSQVQMVVEERGANTLQVSIMSAIDACIDSILSSADNILLEESLNGGLRSRHSHDENSVHTVDI